MKPSVTLHIARLLRDGRTTVGGREVSLEELLELLMHAIETIEGNGASSRFMRRQYPDRGQCALLPFERTRSRRPKIDDHL